MLGIFIDLETTGLDATKHRVLEVAFKIVNLYTGEVQAAFDSVVVQNRACREKSDPVALKVNGFTWEDLSFGKDEEAVGKEIICIFKKNNIQRGSSVFIGQNPSFDRSFFNQLIDVYVQESLFWPYHWLDFASMHWALSVRDCNKRGKALPTEAALSKDKIAKAYDLPEEDKPHRAMNGVNHLLLCYSHTIGFPNINNSCVQDALFL